MANEIFVEGLSRRADYVVAHLTFIYDLATQGVTQGSPDQLGETYAPTPAASLPPKTSAALDNLGAPGATIKGELDAGSKVFEAYNFPIPDGADQAAILAAAQAKYAARADAWAVEYASLAFYHQHIGRSFDAS